MKSSKILILLFVIVILHACSATQETTQTEEQTQEKIYVFDDAGTDSTVTTAPIAETKPLPADTANFIREENVPSQEDVTETETPTGSYIVQVGAFSTKEKAETFIKENQKDCSHKLEVQYSSKVNLFVVWLPKFSTKEEAEIVRNNLWTKEKFKDAFIVTIE